MAVYLVFQNKQFVIVKKRSEFVTVKNDLFWKKIQKICNIKIFIINLQFWDISGKKNVGIILTPNAFPELKILIKYYVDYITFSVRY